MKTGKEKRDEIRSKSVWKFAKQETDFDEAFRAAILFNSYPRQGSINIEDYFMSNHQKYGVATGRHRILSTAQLYGLITKNPFYVRGSGYVNEECTPVFYEMNSYSIGSEKYNELKSEQIIKVKMRAIIDTTDDCDGWNILSVIYAFDVLKRLKDSFAIKEVEIDKFVTYVMTCSDYCELSESIGFLNMDEPFYDDIFVLKDVSRFLKVIENIKLFIIDLKSGMISLNPIFEDYFQIEFMILRNMSELSSHLYTDLEYSKFLYNSQHFGINLINPPKDSEEIFDDLTSVDQFNPTAYEQNEILLDITKRVKPVFTSAEIDEMLRAISVEVANVPVLERIKIAKTLARNSKFAWLVKERAGYRCEICGIEGFMKKDGTRYAEAHHKNELSKTRIDNPHEMICVCPVCHRIIHYGSDDELEKRYAMKKGNHNEQ